MSAELDWGVPVTYADLQRMPDDGHRREIIDGALIVSPSPIPLHQLAVARLHLALAGAAPLGVTPVVRRLPPADAGPSASVRVQRAARRTNEPESGVCCGPGWRRNALFWTHES